MFRKLLIYAVLIVTTHSSGQTWALQLSDINTAVRLRQRDTTSDITRQQFTDQTITNTANEAQRDINNQLWLLNSNFSFVTDGSLEFALPQDLTTILRVTVNNHAIAETTQQDLDQDNTNWTVTLGTPTVYYIDRTVPTNVMIGFWPIPSSNTVCGIAIQYVQIPTAMVGPTDIPFNGRTDLYAYHDMIIDYVSGVLWLSQYAPEMAKPFFDMYASKLVAAKKDIGTMPNYGSSLRGDRGPKQ